MMMKHLCLNVVLECVYVRAANSVFSDMNRSAKSQNRKRLQGTNRKWKRKFF